MTTVPADIDTTVDVFMAGEKWERVDDAKMRKGWMEGEMKLAKAMPDYEDMQKKQEVK